MSVAALRRKITKGRVARVPEGFKVGQSVYFVAISPRPWIMTLEPLEEAERLVPQSKRPGRNFGRRSNHP